MKVKVTFAVICLFKIGLVVGEAQYSPSGYRPSGPKFELPQNQYGAPSISSSNSLPVLPATNFRSSGADEQQQNNNNQIYRYLFEQENSKREQSNFLNQNSFARNNQQYGAPFTSNAQPNAFDLSKQVPSLPQGQSAGNNFDYNNVNRYPPFGNQDQEGRYFGGNAQSGINKQYGEPSRQAQTPQGVRTNINQQSTGTTGQSDIVRNNQRYNYNRNTNQAANNQNQGNDFSRDADDEDTVGISNQNYLPPSTTEAFVRKAAENPNTKEPVDSQEDSRDPNVAISTAFAKGRYYLVQPTGNSQRLTYPNAQIQSLAKNNAYSTNLVYPNVAPISAPFYSYSTPALLRVY